MYSPQRPLARNQSMGNIAGPNIILEQDDSKKSRRGGKREKMRGDGEKKGRDVYSGGGAFINS